MTSEKIKVIFFVPYPIEGASNRYRVNQYVPLLEENGISCDIRPFISQEFYKLVYARGNYLKKFFYFAGAFLNRVKDVINAKNYEVIFIQRESFPFGPPFFEWVLKFFGKKIIYDIDDAIYLANDSKARIKNFFKCPGKTIKIIKICDHLIVCNEYLQNYCKNINQNITIIPTSVDTDVFTIKKYLSKNQKEVTIGWIGSHSTTKYLHKIMPVIEKLSKKHKLKLIIIGANQKFDIAGVETVNKMWKLDEEVKDFQSFDIGIYPLDDDEWVLGKTGFKTIQYMAVGVPGVVSNVGTNSHIVKDGVNGFLAYTEQEWYDKLAQLIENPELRKKMGEEGRKTAVENFSVQANFPKLLKVIELVAGKK